MSKILFYFSDYGANIIRRERNQYGGVGYYRIVKPSQMVRGHEVTVWGTELVRKEETPEERWYRVFKEYDVFWTSYFSDPKEASALFYTRDMMNKKGMNKKVVIDCDDNYIDILESHPLYDKLKAGKRDKAFMSTILTFADIITVSTDPLKQRLQKHFKDIYKMQKDIRIIPNMNDIREWDFVPVAKDPKKFIVGYVGSNSHQDDLAMFFPHLLKIMQKYPHVYFESVGSISKDMLHLFKDFDSSCMNRCDLLPATWTFGEYPKMISEQKWNVGVAPLVDSAFTRCKSHIKYFDYGCFGIPTIASNVYPYVMPVDDREIITDGVDGFISKPSQWFDIMERLVLDPQLGIEAGQKAKGHIIKDWQYKDSDITERINQIVES